MSTIYHEAVRTLTRFGLIVFATKADPCCTGYRPGYAGESATYPVSVRLNRLNRRSQCRSAAAWL